MSATYSFRFGLFCKLGLLILSLDTLDGTVQIFLTLTEALSL